MKKIHLIIASLLLSAMGSRAQQLTPTDLFQINKYWQMNDAHFDKNTFDYIQTIDKHWGLRIPPQQENNGLTLLLGYFKDNKWYQDDQCRIMLSYDPNQRSTKSILYIFNDIDVWVQFNKQLAIMNAVSLSSTDNNGGHSNTWRVNDIVISLTNFPPGVNGIDRSYQIQFIHMP